MSTGEQRKTAGKHVPLDRLQTVLHILISLIAFFIVLSAVFGVIREAIIRSGGVQTMGTVTHHYGSGKHQSYDIEYEANGQTYTSRKNGSSKTGDTMVVVYDTQDPSDNVEGESILGSIIAASIIAPAFMFIGIFFLRKAIKHKKESIHESKRNSQRDNQ